MKEFPEVIQAEWARLSTGSFGTKEGDIFKAYSAHMLPKVRSFTHDGHLFTCLGIMCNFFEPEANCYPLIRPEDYTGPAETAFSYEGAEVIYAGNKFRLGRKVRFVAMELSVEHCQAILRTGYADIATSSKTPKPFKDTINQLMGLNGFKYENWGKAALLLIENNLTISEVKEEPQKADNTTQLSLF